MIADAQHRLSFVQPFLADLRDNVAAEKIEDPDDLAEVNLSQIVEEELKRMYESGCLFTEEEQTQPQDAVPVDSEQGEASQENVSSELPPKQRPHTQTGGIVAQIALIQARLEGKRQKVAPYKALKARGYTRSAMEYLLTEMRGSSQEECA